MFGLSFKDRTRKVIATDLDYGVAPMFEGILKGICKQAAAYGRNEYDAAIFFVAAAMDSLSDPASDAKAKAFIDEKSRQAYDLIPKVRSPRTEVIPFLDALRTKAGLSRLEACARPAVVPSGAQTEKSAEKSVAGPWGGEAQNAKKKKADRERDKAEAIKEFFRVIDFEPDNPVEDLEEILAQFVTWNKQEAGFLNKVTAGFFGAVEAAGGHDGLRSMDYDDLTELPGRIWDAGWPAPIGWSSFSLSA